MTKISSQDFRNTYEKFYDDVRQYLWPYTFVEDLADLEVEIYTTFIDPEKIEKTINKLRSPLNEVIEDNDDENLKKSFKELQDLLSEVKEGEQYSLIKRVEEVNPDENKQIKNTEEDSEEQLEDSEYQYEEEDSEGEFGI